MYRRHFTQALAACAVTTIFLSYTKSDSEIKFAAICATSKIAQFIFDEAPQSKVAIFIFSQTISRPIGIDLPFGGNHILQNSKNSSQMLVFLKWGRYLANVDIYKNNVIKIVENEKHKRLFGHGAFSPDGHSYFCTGMDDRFGLGFVVEKKSSNHELVRSFPSCGIYPHDIQWNPLSEMLIVAHIRRHGNLGEKKLILPSSYSLTDSNQLTVGPCIVSVDLYTNYKRQQIDIKTTHANGPSHFVKLEQKILFIFGVPVLNNSAPSLICSVNARDQLNMLPDESNLYGEALSIISAQEDLWITLPFNNQVIGLNAKSFKIFEKWNVDTPTGILLWPNSELWVASKSNSKIYKRKTSEITSISCSYNDSKLGSHFSLLQSLA